MDTNLFNDETVNNILNVNISNVTMIDPYYPIPQPPKPKIPATVEYAQSFITTDLMNTMLNLFYTISPPTMEYFHTNCNQEILSSITQLVNLNKKENNAFLEIILDLKPPFTDLTWESIKEQLETKDSQTYKRIEDLSEIDKENKDLQIIVQTLKYVMLYLKNKNKAFNRIKRKSVSSYESKKEASKKISEWMLNILYSPDYKHNYMYQKTKINFERKKIKHD